MNNSKSICVLIAEDDDLISDMIKSLLEKIGYTIVGQATNGLQAVEMTQTLQPDVILMDIAMPDMDGIEATRLIQGRCPTPVVMLTAYDRPELIERATAAGAGAYLVKPPDTRTIERAIITTTARFGDMMELRRLNAELRAEVAERKRAQERLQYRFAMEDLITTISIHFINVTPGEIDNKIKRALQAIGEFVSADHCYIHLLSGNGTTIEQMYEWCSEDAGPQIETVKKLSFEPFQWTMGKLKRFETLYIPRVTDLPLEAKAEKEFWQAQEIQSILAIPLALGKNQFGYLGFSSRDASIVETWAEENIRLLRLVGEILTNVLSRK